MTKRIFALLAVTALLTAGTALAGDWTGEVVEMSCYTRNGSKGEAHAACAKTCMGKLDLEKAAMGDSIGLLIGEEIKKLKPADDGALEALTNLAGKQVTVSGSLDGDTITVASAQAAG